MSSALIFVTPQGIPVWYPIGSFALGWYAVIAGLLLWKSLPLGRPLSTVLQGTQVVQIANPCPARKDNCRNSLLAFLLATRRDESIARRRREFRRRGCRSLLLAARGSGGVGDTLVNAPSASRSD